MGCKVFIAHSHITGTCKLPAERTTLSPIDCYMFAPKYGARHSTKCTTTYTHHIHMYIMNVCCNREKENHCVIVRSLPMEKENNHFRHLAISEPQRTCLGRNARIMNAMDANITPVARIFQPCESTRGLDSRSAFSGNAVSP